MAVHPKSLSMCRETLSVYQERHSVCVEHRWLTVNVSALWEEIDALE